MKKRIAAVFLGIALAAAAAGCSGEAPQTALKDLDLTGEWKQSNGDSKDEYQAAYLSESGMEVYWVTDGGDTMSLYWAGSFTPPAAGDKEPYSWESKNDTSKTTGAALASNDGSKRFTYENGEISFSVSAMGTTSTIRMKKEAWGYNGDLIDAEGESSSPSEASEAVQAASSNETVSSEPEDDEKNMNTPDPEKEISLSELEIKEYHYYTDYGSYGFLVIKNNSDSNISLSANVTFYGEGDALVGASSDSEDAVESGYSAILSFRCDESFSRMDYEVEPKAETDYACVLSDLSYEAGETENKVILAVTNNGEDPAEYVQATVLFFNGEEAVGFDYAYIDDDDGELKPGKTISKETYCYEAFDSYQVFFSGTRPLK